jgi:VanZ family protein
MSDQLLANPQKRHAQSFDRLNSSRVPERLWLLICVVSVILCTLAPFEPPLPLTKLPWRIHEALLLDVSFVPLVAHFTLFFLLGVLLVNVYETSLLRWPLLKLVFVAVAICSVLEATQLFQQARHARLNDIAVNALALSLGVILSTSWKTGCRLRRALREALNRLPYAEVVVLALAVIVWWSIGLRPVFGGLRMDWDKSFPLVIGNEIGGQRPWLGNLRYVGIYDRALSRQEILRILPRHFPAGEMETRFRFGLLTGYDLAHVSGNKVAAEGTLRSDELALESQDGAIISSQGEVKLAKRTLLRTHGSASSLNERIASVGKFSVEVWAEPLSLDQAGPARIVTVSDSVAFRNFTLGQSGDTLVFRVRNRVNGSNGNDHELEARGLIDQGFQDVIAVYDHGVSTIFKNGAARAEIDLREPIFYSHLATGGFGRGALVAMALIMIGFPAFALAYRSTRRATVHFAVLVLAFLICAAPYAISCFFVGGPWRISFFGWLLVAFLLICPVGLYYIMREEGTEIRPGAG